jgi:hypothetical protein
VEGMSLDPRNIVADGPDVMSKVLAIGILPLSSSGEGSPIYTTIDAEASVSGNFTSGVYDYSFSGSTTIDQRIRVDIRSIVGGVDFAGEHYEIIRDNDVSSWVDFGVITGGAELEFAAVQSNILGCNGGTPPFAPPNFYPATDIDGYIDGTRVDNSDPTPISEPSSIQLLFGPPYFTGSIQDGDLKMVVSLAYVIDSGDFSGSFTYEIDASSWTTLDFRDIRGTYGTTSTDDNGIEYIWSVTIG